MLLVRVFKFSLLMLNKLMFQPVKVEELKERNIGKRGRGREREGWLGGRGKYRGSGCGGKEKAV